MTLAPGGYFLIQEGGGASGTALDPDATGTILMQTGAGKVALTSSTTVLTGLCPIGLTEDLVAYGGGAQATCFVLEGLCIAHNDGNRLVGTDVPLGSAQRLLCGNLPDSGAVGIPVCVWKAVET